MPYVTYDSSTELQTLNCQYRDNFKLFPLVSQTQPQRSEMTEVPALFIVSE